MYLHYVTSSPGGVQCSVDLIVQTHRSLDNYSVCPCFVLFCFVFAGVENLNLLRVWKREREYDLCVVDDGDIAVWYVDDEVESFLVEVK